jgi:IS1 family transposase
LEGKADASLECIGFEIDECWSFVQNKEDKAWVWVVYDSVGKQVIAFEVGKRDSETFQKLWDRIPEKYRTLCDFISDDYTVYKGIIPEEQHYIGKTLSQRVERLFNTVRQRCSRLVRKTLSFSKSWDNHRLAIGYFFWQFNLEKQALHL